MAVLALVLAVAWLPTPARAQSAPVAFDALSDVQKRLLTDFYRRADGAGSAAREVRGTYDAAPVSMRDSFEAITRLLSTTLLTDAENGEVLGTALDLVDHLEGADEILAGAVGAGPFRLAVGLAPGALDRLRRASEFHRADGSGPSAGFPILYQSDGAPGLSISTTDDGARGVIEVR